MKRFFSFIVSVILIIGLINPVVYAVDDDGKIDLYEVFSSKEDKMKNEVGSRIYKWSMHLPDDAVIYKSERANFFDMSTNSYQASVELEVNKNKDELTLEEMLYKIQNESIRENYWDWGDKEFVVDIVKDNLGQRYIRTIKANKVYDRFMVDEAAEELGEYIENRIYIANNYIYDLTISMDGEFYRQHEEMFDKLASSFKLSFEENNPYIKELSDSVSTTREYKNKSYGWKLVMSPYWKVEGTPNSRYQKFRPVYSDEELDVDSKIEEDSEDELKISEGITVSLISSAEAGENASKWAQEEIQLFKDNYNSDVYDIIKSEARKQGNIDTYHVVIKYKTVTKKPYIVHNLYAVGNGYKYLVSAIMTEEQYKDDKKRNSFENMVNSFELDKECLSKYLGKIITAKSIINLNDLKELKMKKYNFKTKVTKSWNTFNDRDYFYDDFYYNKYEDSAYRGDISNDEHISVFEPTSNMSLDMSAGLDTNEINEIVKERVEKFIEDDEIRMGLAQVKIKSAKYNGANLYYIEKEYNLDAINNFVNEDETKVYDLEKLKNEYEYIIKIGKDTYIQSIMLPVANSTSKNKLKVNNIWENTFVNEVNYSKVNLQWKEHNLKEFDKERK
ncbi:hypothetical protein [Tepidibacter formicigenes]|jgi:hypothetical protein|uniref:Uncharacterized protein n=1 Tax=Tepidibacter formicigenes DSM 15518 TaxID=1123349 RepID=A0A1M6JSQ4_9FIRM|nr:hypothetical protein [Tepidibacter formicigenes]SHJ49701.1 hypothetical protein SAMN02744037_00197 [Tepidibacter formicigenes DSM 15518]